MSFKFETTMQVWCEGVKFGLQGQAPEGFWDFKVWLKGVEITPFISRMERAELEGRMLAKGQEVNGARLRVELAYLTEVECEGVYKRGFGPFVDQGGWEPGEPNEMLDFKVYLIGPNSRLEVTTCLAPREYQGLYEMLLEEEESHD